MSKTRQLPHDQIATYFDTYTRQFLRQPDLETVLETLYVEITGPEIGAQHLLEGVLLTGITYESGTRTLDFAFDSGDHRIYEPREVWVDEAPNGAIRAIEVVTRDGAKEVIELRSAGALPAG